MTRTIILSVLLFAATTAVAQTPYAGLQTRQVKALSEQQVADLRAGRGMGLALPAELNGYPGPVHVLELADKLQLSEEQTASMQAMFAAMKAEAIPLGNRIIEQEAELDRQFASRSVTAESLRAATTAIAATQGQLREAHLKYHLATNDVLSPAQREKYAELRGYGGAHRPHHHK
jgi:Spy/CpxP family protein refolding chaperone